MVKLLILCLVFYVDVVYTAHSVFRGHTTRYRVPPPPPVQDARTDAISTKYFEQQLLDHFDPTNTGRWTQRYYVNTNYFNNKTKDVAFLMLGGEAAASIGWMSGGAWLQSAQKYGAIMFQLEHRYYGESQPLSDLSLESLRYLTSEQALGDMAKFISAMNEEYQFSSDIKWIIYGGSYSGSLAAWARLKYPHLVHGAMSASGPLFAKLNFPEYMQVVANDLASYSQECVDTVRKAIEQVESALSNPGNENITSLFNLCDNIENDLDNTWEVANFFESLTDVFAWIAQYNKIFEGETSVDDLCDILTNSSLGKEIYRLVEVNKLQWDEDSDDCISYKYDDALESLQNISITQDGSDRQWFYQTCTEYGWYQTTDQEIQVFGNRGTVDYFTRVCKDAYGERFNDTFISAQANRTNTDYGGYDIEVSNVVFVHGSFDPWSAVGLTQTRNAQAPVIFINGTAHCANMYASSDYDIPELAAAKTEVDRLVGMWLGITSA